MDDKTLRGSTWTKQRAMKRLQEIAEKANTLSLNLPVLYPVPLASTVSCIQRMTAQGIELSPVILAAITKTETVNTV